MKKNPLKKYLFQTENKLIARQNCTLYIHLTDYTKEDIILNEEEETLQFKSLISKIEFEDTNFNLILDYLVEFDISEYGTDILKKKVILMQFNESETILTVPTEADVLTEQVRYVKRLLGGKEIFQDINHLFLKLYNVYKPLSGTDLVHLEVMLSQCLRDKNNPEIAARMGKEWNPIMLNIKQVIFSKSFIEGLAFENINESIKTGLISEDVNESSILERLLTGTLVEEEKASN
jgi:hypothetical protein